MRVVDVLQDFTLAAQHNILVTPTLVVLAPPPPVVIIGNLSDRVRVRSALHLKG